MKQIHKELSIEKNLDLFADVEKAIEYERRNSYKYGGMTVMGPAVPKHAMPPKKKEQKVKQLSLFDDESKDDHFPTTNEM